MESVRREQACRRLWQQNYKTEPICKDVLRIPNPATSWFSGMLKEVAIKACICLLRETGDAG